MRYDLMEKNKTTKYFKYAMGEILLVMAGILLALQINNWNEERKSSIKEEVNLKSLKSEMMSSLEELNRDQEFNQIHYQSTVNVHKYIQTKSVLVDSMYRDFYLSVQFNYFFPKTSTYETLKSGNLEIIQSDSLRILITDVYETGYERIFRKINTRRNAARILFPYYQKHFQTKMILGKDLLTGNIYLGIPNDYEFLINDPEYETLVAEAIVGRKMAIRDFKNTIEFVENCIIEIDNYLE